MHLYVILMKHSSKLVCLKTLTVVVMVHIFHLTQKKNVEISMTVIRSHLCNGMLVFGSQMSI